MKTLLILTILLIGCAPTKLITAEGQIIPAESKEEVLKIFHENPDANLAVFPQSGRYNVVVSPKPVFVMKAESRVLQANSIGEVQLLINQYVADGWSLNSVGASEGAIKNPVYIITVTRLNKVLQSD